MVNVRGRAEVSSPIFLPAESKRRSVLQLLASSQPPGLSFPPCPPWRTGVFPVHMPHKPQLSAWNRCPQSLVHSGLLSVIHLCCPWLFIPLESRSTNGNKLFFFFGPFNYGEAESTCVSFTKEYIFRLFPNASFFFFPPKLLDLFLAVAPRC